MQVLSGRGLASKCSNALYVRYGWNYRNYFLMMALSISSVNVRSVCSGWRRAMVFDFLSEIKSDIICIQECGVEKIPSEDWKHGISLWSPMCDSRNEGVGILVRGAEIKCVQHDVVVPGRMQVAIMEVKGIQVRVINCYAPAVKKERVSFFNTLKLWLPGRIPTLLVGDMNCVRKNEERQGVSMDSSTDVTSGLLNEMVRDFNLRDMAVEVEQNGVSFTYYSDKGSVRSRIDFIFVSRFCKILGYQVEPVLFSDHCLISGVVSLEEGGVSGRGQWKLNCSLMEEEGVYAKFASFYGWLTFKKRDFSDILVWWDWAKERIGSFFRKLGVEKARKKRMEERRLVDQLHFLFRCKRMGIEVEEEIKEVRGAREALLKERGKSIIFRAKVEQIEEDEQCSSFFFKKSFGPRKTFQSVVEGEEEVRTTEWWKP